MRSVAELNDLPGDAAAAALASCCTSRRWVRAVVAGRPYASAADLLAGSDAAVADLAEADLREALAGHPRLGERAPAGHREEQAGVSGADSTTLRALAEGNADYERRFGHVYLACATGRGAGELLTLLRERLGNEPEAEWRVVAAQLAEINRIRLTKLIGGEA